MALSVAALSLGLQLLLLLDLAIVIVVALQERQSNGVRVQHTDMFRGATWTAQLVNGHEEANFDKASRARQGQPQDLQLLQPTRASNTCTI